MPLLRSIWCGLPPINKRLSAFYGDYLSFLFQAQTIGHHKHLLGLLINKYFMVCSHWAEP